MTKTKQCKYPCPFCKNYCVSTLYTLKHHIRRVHLYNIICPVCHRHYKSLYNFVLHCKVKSISEQQDEDSIMHYLLYSLCSKYNDDKTESEKMLKKYSYLLWKLI
ncbi:Zn finger protein [Sulfolobales Beppu filamentous virus 3]|uniref:Zn finger protein n=1 Tax=Sulfolobales Beppu filamentous virus 3 TaxID=2493124 RepID=A0A3S8NF76_9VIRU|nr:Zn finger protein [Sulfolobales Beppu filamentous virus 3]AZI75881.1 Zn finger protein [Sulfolobales Beppu filamentous virus 3]